MPLYGSRDLAVGVPLVVAALAYVLDCAHACVLALALVLMVLLLLVLRALSFSYNHQFIDENECYYNQAIRAVRSSLYNFPVRSRHRVQHLLVKLRSWL